MKKLNKQVSFKKWLIFPILIATIIGLVASGIIWVRANGGFELPWEKNARLQKQQQVQELTRSIEEVTEQFLIGMFSHATARPTDVVSPETTKAYQSISINITSRQNWSSQGIFLANTDSYLLKKYSGLFSYDANHTMLKDILMESTASTDNTERLYRGSDGIEYKFGVAVRIPVASADAERYDFRFIQEDGAFKIDSITFGGGAECNIFTPENNTNNQFCKR